MTKLWLNTFLQKNIPANADAFNYFMNIKGEIFRQVKNRETLRFALSGKTFFIKKHFGCGIKEWLKNLCRLRLPIRGAKNELAVIRLLEKVGVPTMTIAAFGFRGKKSFIVTEELKPIIGLRDLANEKTYKKTSFFYKKMVVEEIAHMARKMHQAGVAHRDFYLAHFQMDANSPKEKPLIYLIDLHRSIIQKPLKKRWIIKDLSSLYFSSMEAGLTKRDILRFLKSYFAESVSSILKTKKRFINEIEKKAKALYKKRDI